MFQPSSSTSQPLGLPKSLPDLDIEVRQIYQEVWMLQKELVILTTKLRHVRDRITSINRELPPLAGERDSEMPEFSDCDWFDV